MLGGIPEDPDHFFLQIAFYWEKGACNINKTSSPMLGASVLPQGIDYSGILMDTVHARGTLAVCLMRHMGTLQVLGGIALFGPLAPSGN